MPPTSRGIIGNVFGPGKNAFRAREKYLILMVLVTFGFVCFGAIFFLPDKGLPTGAVDESQEPMNKVYRVYKGIQDVGRDLVTYYTRPSKYSGDLKREHLNNKLI